MKTAGYLVSYLVSYEQGPSTNPNPDPDPNPNLVSYEHAALPDLNVSVP